MTEKIISPKRATSFNLTEELRKRLKVVAATRDVDMTQAVTEAIERWIRNWHEPESPPEGEVRQPEITPSTLSRSAVIQHLASLLGRKPNEADIPWLSIALQVLQSKKPGLPKALQSNLEQFRDTEVMWNERHGSQDASPGEPGYEGGTGGQRPPVTPIGRSGGGAAGSIERARQAMDEAEQIEKTGRSGKKGSHDAPRKRS